ncbi:MAG: hypothetical protein IKA20_02485 [Clostridia bacterium]|nr:hypothetical protein [Clostridia bacterium]
MKDIKKLAKIEGIITLVTAGLLLFSILFFFFYDANAMGVAPNPDEGADSNAQLSFGIGRAFQLIFMVIGFGIACVPTAIMLILGGVQLGIHNKKGVSRVCTVLAMIFKLVAAGAMFWNLLFVFQPWVRLFSKVWYVFIFCMMITSFAWSIAVLVLRKKILAMPLKEVHSEEDSKPDEMVIYPEGQMPQIEEEEVVFYPEGAEQAQLPSDQTEEN